MSVGILAGSARGLSRKPCRDHGAALLKTMNVDSLGGVQNLPVTADRIIGPGIYMSPGFGKTRSRTES